MRLKRIFFLIIILVTACSGSEPTESELVAQNKLEGGPFSQDAAFAAASSVAEASIQALAIAPATNPEVAAAVKLAQMPALNCGPGLSGTVSEAQGGLATINGNCTASDSSCSYLLAGTVSFRSWRVAPDKLLIGDYAFQLKVDFPGCNPDPGQAEVYLKLPGPIVVDDLELLQVEATFRLVFDSEKGVFVPVMEALYAPGRFRGLNCLSGLETSSCFEDEDNDFSDDETDNCVALTNPRQTDTDADGIGDLCDNCPAIANPDQADSNMDGQGDACPCAPNVAACEMATECPGVDDSCRSGCCQACTPDAFTGLQLTCERADEINSRYGLSGGCSQFGHDVCNAQGCCEYVPSDEVVDLCDDPDPEFPGFCGGSAGFGFCSVTLGVDYCFVIETYPEADCPFIDNIGASIECSTYGQAVCNQLIGTGAVSLDTFCNGTCCVEP